MKYLLKHADDLHWFLAHTNGFRGGYITDVRMSKKRLFDEESKRDVLVGTTVAVVVRYCAREMLRVARLTMQGVSDFSILEQEGEDCSLLSAIQAETTDERLRFWFDPEGRLYVVCEEAMFEELASPAGDWDIARAVANWTFQAEEGDVPTVEWLLRHLDQAGVPCVWQVGRAQNRRHAAIRWEGRLTPFSGLTGERAASVHVMAHGTGGCAGFGMTLRAPDIPDPHCGQVLTLIADLIARTYPGTCVAGDAFLSCDEWLSGTRDTRSRQMR
jgi:hypothetical protein